MGPPMYLKGYQLIWFYLKIAFGATLFFTFLVSFVGWMDERTLKLRRENDRLRKEDEWTFMG